MRNAFKEAARQIAAPTEPAKQGKRAGVETVTLRLPVDLVSEAKDAAFWDRETLTQIFAASLKAELEKRVAKRGEPYPPRDGDLKPTGRPKS